MARGLVNRPDILMMDEPFGAVDPVVRRKLQEEVLSLRERLGTTVLMVTHDIDEAFIIGDQVVVLGPQARIEQAATPAQIVSHPASETVRDFTGAASRELTVAERDGSRLLIDASGTVKGVLK